MDIWSIAGRSGVGQAHAPCELDAGKKNQVIITDTNDNVYIYIDEF